MLIVMLRRKSHTFYSSEREFTNNFITNDTKGSLAKDLVFLRKLEHYLKDGETTRE